MKDFKTIIVKEVDVKGILTKSNLPVCDYSVNPYIGCTHACQYCYATFMKRFTGHLEPWGSFVDVKDWEEIKNPQKYNGKAMFIGSVTDPYQPLEEKYEKTRILLKQLKGIDVAISIATKSDLVLRDIELIKSFSNARVAWSINTLDENFKNDMDNAVSIERRLNVMKKFYDEKIRTTCFISPIFPGITDVKEIIKRAKDQCNLIWLENLNLRGDYKAVVLDYIKNNYAHLYPLYEQIYKNNDRTYWQELDKEIKQFCKEEGLLYVRDDDSIIRPLNAPPIVVNYFYHEEITPSAKKKKSK